MSISVSLVPLPNCVDGGLQLYASSSKEIYLPISSRGIQNEDEPRVESEEHDVSLIAEGEIYLGRKLDSLVRLKDQAISGKHCIISWNVEEKEASEDSQKEEQNLCFFTDTSLKSRIFCLYITDVSTNGTWIDGLKVERKKKTQLFNDQIISLAKPKIFGCIEVQVASFKVSIKIKHKIFKCIKNSNAKINALIESENNSITSMKNENVLHEKDEKLEQEKEVKEYDNETEETRIEEEKKKIDKDKDEKEKEEEKCAENKDTVFLHNDILINEPISNIQNKLNFFSNSFCHSFSPSISSLTSTSPHFSFLNNSESSSGNSISVLGKITKDKNKIEENLSKAILENESLSLRLKNSELEFQNHKKKLENIGKELKMFESRDAENRNKIEVLLRQQQQNKSKINENLQLLDRISTLQEEVEVYRRRVISYENRLCSEVSLKNEFVEKYNEIKQEQETFVVRNEQQAERIEKLKQVVNQLEEMIQENQCELETAKTELERKNAVIMRHEKQVNDLEFQLSSISREKENLQIQLAATLKEKMMIETSSRRMECAFSQIQKQNLEYEKVLIKMKSFILLTSERLKKVAEIKLSNISVEDFQNELDSAILQSTSGNISLLLYGTSSHYKSLNNDNNDKTLINTNKFVSCEEDERKLIENSGKNSTCEESKDAGSNCLFGAERSCCPNFEDSKDACEEVSDGACRADRRSRENLKSIDTTYELEKRRDSDMTKVFEKKRKNRFLLSAMSNESNAAKCSSSMKEIEAEKCVFGKELMQKEEKIREPQEENSLLEDPNAKARRDQDANINSRYAKRRSVNSNAISEPPREDKNYFAAEEKRNGIVSQGAFAARFPSPLVDVKRLQHSALGDESSSNLPKHDFNLFRHTHDGNSAYSADYSAPNTNNNEDRHEESKKETAAPDEASFGAQWKLSKELFGSSREKQTEENAELNAKAASEEEKQSEQIFVRGIESAKRRRKYHKKNLKLVDNEKNEIEDIKEVKLNHNHEKHHPNHTENIHEKSSLQDASFPSSPHQINLFAEDSEEEKESEMLKCNEKEKIERSESH